MNRSFGWLEVGLHPSTSRGKGCGEGVLSERVQWELPRVENWREMGRKHDTHHPPPIFLEPPRKKRWPRDSRELPVGAGSWPARQRWVMGLPSPAIKVLLQPGQLQHRVALFIRNDPKGSSHGGTQGLVAKFRQCHPQPGGILWCLIQGCARGAASTRGTARGEQTPSVCCHRPHQSLVKQ